MQHYNQSINMFKMPAFLEENFCFKVNMLNFQEEISTINCTRSKYLQCKPRIISFAFFSQPEQATAFQVFTDLTLLELGL